jgi:glycosyltransferase involved in cell wall biosynthesis
MADTLANLKDPLVTVVIATLGGPTLKSTIEALNRGSVVPAEILICIPIREADRVSNLGFSNVKVVVTSCRGQVAQRAIGFQKASHGVVMQIDDDMLVDKECMSHLLDTLYTKGPKVAVAPSLISLETGESAYKKPDRNRFLASIYYWLMNGSAGYQEGAIDKSGAPVGIDPKGNHQQLFNVEWLAGGCVMHFKENLVLENFYPFEGKAFYEDIIHSYHLKEKGLYLIVDARARCAMEVFYSSRLSAREFLRNLGNDFRARKYFMQLSARGYLRMYFFYIASLLSYAFKKAGGTLLSNKKK